MSRLYVTATEATDWPTGLDLQNLIPDGTSAQQAAQLGAILQAASSYVEQITLQPLYARVVTETSLASADLWARLQVPLRSFPALSVLAAQWLQSTADGWQSINVANAHIYGALRDLYWADDAPYYPGVPGYTVTSQYVSGYPNAVLTAPSALGAVSLAVDDATGMTGSTTLGAITLPGTTLVIYDAATQAQETVAVQSVSGSTVTLTAGTQYAHAAGVRVSALPPAVSTATIYLAAWMIKERRAGGGTLMGGQVLPADGGVDLKMATELLQPFRRVI
ncbi:MAG: hypothetical protein ACYCU7_18905 [Acidimicrobiales bacterium]